MIKKGLMKASWELEHTCWNSEGFSELVLDSILSYTNSQAGKTQALQQKLRDLKQQISERGLLDPPKFGSCQNVFDEADWKYVAASAAKASVEEQDWFGQNHTYYVLWQTILYRISFEDS